MTRPPIIVSVLAMLSMVYLLLRSLGPPIRLCRYATANESLSNAQMLVCRIWPEQDP